MSVRRDKIFVIDFEATCWGRYPPEGQCSDIIEIGIVDLDLKTLEIGDKESVLIKPTRSSVSRYCTRLTNITPEDLKGAHEFHTSMNYINNKYSPFKRTWAAWGSEDFHRIKRECKQKRTDCPFGNHFVDISNLFSLALGHKDSYSVERAVNDLGMDFEGRPHSGLDDAYNTARILATILKRMRNE